MPDFFFADINECKAGKQNCAADANCQNIEGSFVCTCKPGYSGDGVSCTGGDIIRCFILYFIYFISFAYYIIIIKKKQSMTNTVYIEIKNNKCLIRQGCHDSGRPNTVVPELKKICKKQ